MNRIIKLSLGLLSVLVGIRILNLLREISVLGTNGVYFAMLLFVATVSYRVVTGSKVNGVTALLGIVSVYLSAYEFYIQSDLPAVYGLEFVGSVIVSVVLFLVVYFVLNLVIGSIVFGSLGRFSEELERRRRRNHPDPYGDKHAHRILNGDQ